MKERGRRRRSFQELLKVVSKLGKIPSKKKEEPEDKGEEDTHYGHPHDP
jgi:hypothetical protein